MHFNELKLIAPILQSIREAGYENPTPIQQQSIPIILEGHDLLGIAQTGTGKTAAFSLPILQLLETNKKPRTPKSPRALVLTPTRELAIQILQSLQTYGRNLKQKYTVVFGGVGQGNQVRDMSSGVDVLVATPGRLLDLIQQRHIRLDKVEIFVLDEADRMLDMGFMKDIKKILPLLPPHRHNLFFSATMPSEIKKLAHEILKNPKSVAVTPPSTTVEKIKQSVMFVEKNEKRNLLVHLLKNSNMNKVLVFTEMKHEANRVTEHLIKNRISAVAIHGNKSQNARQSAIKDFTNNRVRVLVATDIASRGIDIDGITHVINYQLPHLPEVYVHRIGRTARAGAEGDAVSLCTAEEKSYLVAIERKTNQKITVDTDQPYHSEKAAHASVMSVGKAKAQIEGRRPNPRHQRRRRPQGQGHGQSARPGANSKAGASSRVGANRNSARGTARRARAH